MPAIHRRSHTAVSNVVQRLRNLTGRDHALVTGRGAAGIWAVLRAMGFQNRLVLIPAHTCYMVLWAVLKSGNRPLLYDAGVPDVGASHDSPLSPVGFPPFSEKPAAIIPCHLYGLPAPMTALTAWGREQGIVVIEDAALALGAIVEGQPAGSWGDASIFSFGQGKIADHELGGAVLTDDASLAREVEKLLAALPEWNDRLLDLTNQWNGLYWPLHQYESRNPGLLDLYPRLFGIYGDLTCYRQPVEHWRGLPEILAALPDNLAHRERLAGRYDDLLHAINSPFLRTLPRPTGAILWRYPLLAAPELRDDLLGFLWEQGVHDATRWYPSLRHMTAALAPDMPPVITPQADLLADSIINLRLDPGVDIPDVDFAMSCVRQMVLGQ